MIVLDPALLEEFRGKPRCELCQKRTVRCEPHHYAGRGMGGGSQLDVRENLIALCRACHDLAHRGKIDRADILAAIAAREKKTTERCQQVIWDLLAKKKGKR